MKKIHLNSKGGGKSPFLPYPTNFFCIDKFPVPSQRLVRHQYFLEACVWSRLLCWG